MQSTKIHARPIVKWAGGKSALWSTICSIMPHKYKAYYEPFMGGGAVLLKIIQKQPESPVYASDINQNLVITYQCVRDHPEELLELLRGHAKSFAANRKEYYYYVRSHNPCEPLDRAARLIFLNRTCFNGLYRVNSKGRFNVPIGSYINPDIVQEKNIRAVSSILVNSKCSFCCTDFESALGRHVKPESVVYLDPPYQPMEETGFTKYADKDFTYKDLRRLFDVCQRLDQAGCYVILSNSCSPKVTEMFMDKPWSIIHLKTSRPINSDGSNRKGHCDVLIKNY